MSNSVDGYAAVLYLQVGVAVLQELSFERSNWVEDTPYVSKASSEGGHLYLQGFNLTIHNTSFAKSTAALGGGAYIKTVKDGILLLNNITFNWLLTAINPMPQSNGGCLYLDSSESQLYANLT
jgi:hypothetical protein